jgi:cation:H+ antiporter
VTAFNWARQIRTAPIALLNFISSSVNELTALVALIPIVLFISSRGTLVAIPLDGQQWIEVLLTMSQSLYACAVLFDLEYDLLNGITLFTLWIVSTALIESRIIVSFAFLVLTVVEVYRKRKKIDVFSGFRHTLRTL